MERERALLGILAAAAATTSLSFLVWWEFWGGKFWAYRLPPGPPRLPFLGSLHLVDRAHPQYTIRAWGRRFGGIFTMWLGGRPSIVVTDLQLMKELFVKAEKTCNDRRAPNLYLAREGIFAAEGDDWRERRRLCSLHLQELGAAKAGMERRILTEATELVNALRAAVGLEGSNAVNPLPYLLHSTTSIVLSLVAGIRLSMEEPRYAALLRLTTEAMENCYAMAAPGLSKLLGSDAAPAARKEAMIIMASLLDESRTEWKANPSDDSCLFHRLFAEEEHHLSEANYANLLLDFMVAGSGTTGKTLSFALLYLIRWPEWEERLQVELDQVVGPGEAVQSEHLSQMPLLEAFLAETQRLGNVAAIVPWHAVGSEGVEVRGYQLPPGIPIHMEISAVLSDPQHFPEPDDFKPERFLQRTVDGVWERVTPLPEALCQFGMGQRSCIGEGIARAELFLILASILQAFRVKADSEGSLPSLEPSLGVTVGPLPFTLKLIPKD